MRKCRVCTALFAAALSGTWSKRNRYSELSCICEGDGVSFCSNLLYLSKTPTTVQEMPVVEGFS